MGYPLFHVDAFADRPFAGNPAAICLLPDGAEPEDSWQQSVARELNLSETAFLRRRQSGWDLRWFTPAAEVDLCGHATLASAHVLWETGRAGKESPLEFHTRSGRLSARGGGDGTIELDFPAEPAAGCDPIRSVVEALGAAPSVFFGKNRMDYLAVFGAEGDVRGLRPDFRRLAEACGSVRGVIATAKSNDPRYDFVSRYFAPGFGIDEDPVTGSAHCCLGPYWSVKLEKTELTGYQASSRGGVVGVVLRGERVGLRVRAVSVSRGELL